MFEAVVTLCLLSAPDICRETLSPGYEAPERATCADLLARKPPDPAEYEGLVLRGGPVCAPAGAVAAFSEVAPGVFVHRGAIEEPSPTNLGDTSNVGFVVGETSVAVIDAGGSRAVGEAIYRAVRARTDLPISHLVLTHMHPDHTLGAAVFAEAGAKIVGHRKLGRALADRIESYLDGFADLTGPAPLIGARIGAPNVRIDGGGGVGGGGGGGVGVGEALAIDLGGRALTVRAWPNAHTHTDLTIMDEATETLFVGDLIFHEHAPALDGSARGWLALLETLGETQAARIVPGHGGPVLPWPDAAAPLERYLTVLIKDARAAIDRGESLLTAAETIARSEANAWRLFDLYNARNATVAFTELEWE